MRPFFIYENPLKSEKITANFVKSTQNSRVNTGRLMKEMQFCAGFLTNTFFLASSCFLISYIFAKIL